MGRIFVCKACNNNAKGLKSRVAFIHTCGKSNDELLNEHIGRNRKIMGVKYSDGGDYYNLKSNSEIYPEHSECEMCGSEDVTIMDDKDICHNCGFVYT